ncbi:MAG TPA: ABC transporter permease [Puia sp.]|jgi:predicted permease|nr:ABC transporter permease [Puia sp.]
MLKNFFKTALRNFWNNKGYGSLNILGLAIGIACSTLIFIWVQDEITFDHYFAKRNTLYKVEINTTYQGQIATSDATPGPMAQGLMTEIPGVRNAGRLSWENNQLFSLDDKAIFERGYYADSNILSMLDLKYESGNRGRPFENPSAIVISETMAKQFFGDADGIGKSLKLDNGMSYVVSAVFKDIPANSTLRFEWLAPFTAFYSQNMWLKEWDNFSLTTLVDLDPRVSFSNINDHLTGYLKSKESTVPATAFLFPMNNWHLYNHFTNGRQDDEGQIKYIKLFSLVAWIILIIGCINFTNLATARSGQRAKEIGVRKVLGAEKRSLTMQFIGESLLMSFTSVLLAIGIVYLALNGFNTLVEKHLTLDLLDPLVFSTLLATGLVCGLIAGVYPALYMSSFNPVKILKGLRVKTSAGSANVIRKGLVITQFSISIGLIICTIIIYQQLQHTKERDLGYNKNNLIYLNVHGNLIDHFDALRADLINTGYVENAALSSSSVLQLNSHIGSSYHWIGKDPSSNIQVVVESINPEYFPTMKMTVLHGRNFDPSADTSRTNNTIIINESLAKLMGGSNQVGNYIMDKDNNDQKFRIVGVVKDFVFTNFNSNASSPLIFFWFPGDKFFNDMTIRFKSGVDLQAAMSKTEAIIQNANPGYPFEYHFLDSDFDHLFKTESLIGKLVAIFASLAIFISCFGLFSLAAYTADRRRKELGIRKVLGASTGNLAGLLSAEFLQTVCLSCLIAFPSALWIMNTWLEQYEYRTRIYWWVFAIAGAGTLLIALITVSFQAVKAALANPVRSLRTE